MTKAQIRRAITLNRMGRYADADVCAFWAMRLIEGDRATQKDGQEGKVDENGDYTERASAVSDQARPDKSAGLATAMGSPNSASTSQKNQALTWRIQSLTKMEQLPAGHDGRKIHIVDKYPTPSAPPSTKKATEAPPQTAKPVEKVPATKTSSPLPSREPRKVDASAIKETSVPSYPTSSKKRVDWDAWEKEQNVDEDDKDNIDALFRGIYKDGDDDTKRAMMKSYMESNGTSLSTSWSEAQSKTYETQPPNGAEAKKY